MERRSVVLLSRQPARTSFACHFQLFLSDSFENSTAAADSVRARTLINQSPSLSSGLGLCQRARRRQGRPHELRCLLPPTTQREERQEGSLSLLFSHKRGRKLGLQFGFASHPMRCCFLLSALRFPSSLRTFLYRVVKEELRKSQCNDVEVNRRLPFLVPLEDLLRCVVAATA